MFTFLDKPKQSSNPYMRFSKVFQPQQNTAAPKRDQRIRAVLTANALLQTPERVALVQEIQDLCAASSKNYQTYYEPLIKNFAEFVQQLEHIDSSSPYLAGSPFTSGRKPHLKCANNFYWLENHYALSLVKKKPYGTM